MITLWIREDGEQPKAIESGRRPPGPGRVVEVQARSSNEARAVYAASVREPVLAADRSNLAAWTEAEAARMRVREVTS